MEREHPALLRTFTFQAIENGLVNENRTPEKAAAKKRV